MSRPFFRISLLLFCILPTVPLLFADGGTLQFRKQAGPFVITLFSAPVPLRAGVVDLSVLLQAAEDNSAIAGAKVTLDLTKQGEDAISARATTSQATNKILYAAEMDIPTAGLWHLKVDVVEGGTNVGTTGNINVLGKEPPILTYWLYFAVVPIAIVLFVLNQWIRGKSKVQMLK